MVGDVADWASETITDNLLNKVTHGSGTSFPTTWPIATRMFWRSDLERMYYNKGADNTPLAADWEGANCPTGTVMCYVGNAAAVPKGWLLCDGSTVSQTTYDVLYNRIAAKYGSDAGGNFTLPDMSTGNEMPRGATNDAGLGGTAGVASLTLTAAQSGTAAHLHSAVHEVAGGIGQFSGGTTHANHSATTSNSSAINAVSSHDNMPPYVDFHYIIAV